LRENVTISCRGAGFEVGRGRGFYGIWAIGAPDDKPLAWWPETDEGWSAAWQRFTPIEVPGTIAPAGQAAAPRAAQDFRAQSTVVWLVARLVAAALLGLGVLLGLIGLFPGYIGTPSLTSLPGQLVAHLIYLAGWAGCAALVLLGGTRQRIGALAGIGVSAITLGLFGSDAASAVTATSSNLFGAGLALTLIGWAVCTAGAVLAFLLAGRANGPARLGLRGAPIVPLMPLVTLVIAGIGAAIAFAPSWDRFTVESVTGPLKSVTEGNAFSNPGLVIAANVVTMIAIVAVVVIAAMWRRAGSGAALLAGALVPLVAQAISALVQLGQAVSPDQFGYTPLQVYEFGLTVSSGVTVAFWVFCAFVVALILSAVQMITAPDAAVPWPPVTTPATASTATPSTATPSTATAGAATFGTASFDTAAADSPAADSASAEAAAPDAASPGSAALHTDTSVPTNQP
jgi:hypothetical protein